MFWRREKTVRVELVNPEIRVKAQTEGTQPPPPPTPLASETKHSESSDYAIKLLALIAVVAQGALAIYGYTVLMGYYIFFGINTSELDIGLSTQLFWGYTFFLNDTYGAAIGTPKIGSFIIAIAVIFISWLLVLLISRRLKINDAATTTFLTTLPILAVLFFPAIGASKGTELAKEDFEKHTKSDKSHTFPTETIIQVKKSEKRGMLIVADTKHSFLLVCDKVFKIDNKGYVVRVTLLHPEKQPACTAEQKSPPLSNGSKLDADK